MTNICCWCWRDSAGCPQVLCGCQHYSICPWRCWLRMLSSAGVVCFVPRLSRAQLPHFNICSPGFVYYFYSDCHSFLLTYDLFFPPQCQISSLAARQIAIIKSNSVLPSPTSGGDAAGCQITDVNPFLSKPDLPCEYNLHIEAVDGSEGLLQTDSSHRPWDQHHFQTCCWSVFYFYLSNKSLFF